MLLAFGALALWAGGDVAPAIRIFGGGCVALGLVLGVGVALRARRTGPPAPALVTVDGVTATAIMRDRTDFTVGLVAMLVMALTCVAWAALAASSGSSGGASVLTAAALWLTIPALLSALGRYVAGGVMLTADRLTYRSRGLETTIAWDEVALVVDDVPRGHVAFRSVDGVPVHHRFRAGPWRGERVAGADIGILRTEGLALGPAALARVLDHYARQPAARVELGDPTSLLTVASLSRP